jgi:predicted O-linked N-acetylglucosamine transferase (SPINDLY family)
MNSFRVPSARPGSPPPVPQIDLAQVFARGFALHQQGQLAQAAEHYRTVLRQAPRHFDALHLAGVAAHGLGDDVTAEDLIRKALKLNPKYADAWSNLGQALAGQGRAQDAIAAYRRALALQPDHWNALFNRGSAWLDAKRPKEALADFDRAIELAPDHAEAHNFRSFALCRLFRLAEAIAEANRALELKPDFPEAYINRAAALRLLNRSAAAARDLETAFRIKPDLDYPFSLLAADKSMVCDWSALERGKAATFAEIAQVIKFQSATAWHMLAWSDDPAEIMRMARFAASQVTSGLSVHGSGKVKSPPARSHPDGRIRIGYISSDFGDHPVGQLICQAIELHDRERFEVHGFSIQQRDGALADRIRDAFDHYHDLANAGDAEASAQMRKQGIDIAIYLNGYTAGERPGIFALRAAPVQVNFLGFAATMAADFMDYIVVDPVLALPGSEANYTEQLVRLPNSYMPSDTTRTIAERPMTRAEWGLPDDGFVFCSFNNNYKIMPDVFATWMRLLEQVPGSVLWLRKGQEEARENLRAAAAGHGIDPDRLVFAGFADLADHFARHRLADLFLDTFPYGAHTTANDALWAGLPVLTMAGLCYHSRVAASLLNAVGLPELVTDSLAGYEALALELARDPARLAAITARLRASRDASPLFDMPRWTRDLERAFAHMAARARAGLPPEGIDLAPVAVD